jgi:uncharacterized protein YjbK
MAHHLEVELKWALEPAGYARLAGLLAGELGPARVLEQDNRFFDAADLRLRRAGLNLRLRREDGRLLMTSKRRAGAGGEGVHRHDEWEEWLDPGLWERLDAPDLAAALPLPEPVRAALGGAPLVALGGFANRREEFRSASDGREDLLCLDRTVLPGGRIDHELEIETSAPEAAAAEWGARLRAWTVAFTPQPATKFARFLAALDGTRAT